MCFWIAFYLIIWFFFSLLFLTQCTLCFLPFSCRLWCDISPVVSVSVAHVSLDCEEGPPCEMCPHPCHRGQSTKVNILLYFLSCVVCFLADPIFNYFLKLEEFWFCFSFVEQFFVMICIFVYIHDCSYFFCLTAISLFSLSHSQVWWACVCGDGQ